MARSDDQRGPPDGDLEFLLREIGGGGREKQQTALDRLADAGRSDRNALERLLALAEKGPEEGVLRVIGTLGMVEHPEVLIFLLQRQRAETSRKRLKTIRRAIHRLTSSAGVLRRARELAGESMPELFTLSRLKSSTDEERGKPQTAQQVSVRARLDSIRIQLLDRLPRYRVDLLETWGFTSGLGKVARIAQLLESYLLAATHRAASAAHVDPEAVLRATVGPNATLERASMGQLVAVLKQFFVDDMPADIRAVVDDARREQTTLGALVAIRNSVLHAEAASIFSAEGSRDSIAIRDEFLALTRRLENVLRWKAEEWSMSHLVVESVGHCNTVSSGFRYAIGPLLSIGRRPTCDVWVSDEAVSRLHLTLEERADAQVLLVDKSSGGSFINDARVGSASLLGDGDLVRAGPVAFRFTAGAKS